MAEAEKLLHEPSVENRQAVVARIAEGFSAGELSSRERTIASQIFRLLLNDVEVQVRRAMAEALRNTPLLPHDIALTLARDLSEVAVPILKSSEVLTDQDLIEIIRNPVGAKLIGVDGEPDLMVITQDTNPDSAKHLAITERSTLSWRVSAALVENGTEEVAVVLVENPGAELTEPVARRLVDRFGASPRLQTALIDRKVVPVTVLERLAFLVSDELRKRLVAQHELSQNLSSTLALLARERATMKLLGEDAGEEQAARLARQLWEEERLTPTILLRAACIGEFEFFENALARLANMSVLTVRALLRDPGARDVDDLFRSAGLPARTQLSMRTAIELAAELVRDGVARRSAEFIRAMINGIMPRTEPSAEPAYTHDLNADELEYVLARVSR